MNKFFIHTRSIKILADTITPVGIYLNLRDRFTHSFLLESSDYHGSENSISYICCDPIAYIKVIEDRVITQFPDEQCNTEKLTNLKKQLERFVTSFESKTQQATFTSTGLFGYMSYDCVEHFEDINIQKKNVILPIAQYHLFRFVIALDHFRNQCHIIESYLNKPDDKLFDEVKYLVQIKKIPSYPFNRTGATISSDTDEAFLKKVSQGIQHCKLGDVLQIVLSRNFALPFQGDEFQVYRQLRSINPSPYLFYFDYGNFRIFGSSPEAQLILKEKKAEIHPIAGTFKRTGSDEADQKLAEKLLEDPKENSEHVMLVDLARNDLNRSCDHVIVESYKRVQYYSHVIHLGSKVTGQIRNNVSFIEIIANTFPAGTLSGAPKVRALQLIDTIETTPRGLYGGAVGFMDFKGNYNHAIMIRSFVSHNNQLKYRAGAGVVAESNQQNELQEVYNKVSALEKSLLEAESQ